MAKAASKRESELAGQATFVFRGTVLRLKAATLPNVPVTAKTAVVRVDEILRAPEALSHFVGQEITVVLGSRETVKKGEEAVFYTNSWLVGEGLAVQSVGHTPAPPAGEAKRGAQMFEGETDRRLSEQVADADAVVTGRVISVRALDEDSARGSAELFQPITEHRPVWQEAVVEVSDVLKGDDTPRRITVRFPESTDVRWYEAPKFHPGQEGVFLVRKERARKGARTSRARKAAGPEVYTALDAEAFQPAQRIESIRALVESSRK